MNAIQKKFHDYVWNEQGDELTDIETHVTLRDGKMVRVMIGNEKIKQDISAYMLKENSNDLDILTGWVADRIAMDPSLLIGERELSLTLSYTCLIGDIACYYILFDDDTLFDLDIRALSDDEYSRLDGEANEHEERVKSDNKEHRYNESVHEDL